MDDRELELAYNFIHNFHKLSYEFLNGTIWHDTLRWAKINRPYYNTNIEKYELELCHRIQADITTETDFVTLYERYSKSNGSHTLS